MARISFVGSGGTPGGTDTQVQFNDSGSFGGDAGLTYNKTTDTLTGVSIVATSGFTGSLLGNASSADTASLAANSTLFDGRAVGTFAGLSANTFTGVQTFTNAVTGTSAYFSGDIVINGTASISILETRNQQSLVVGDKFIVILSGAADHVGLDGAGLLFGSGSAGPTVDENGANAYMKYKSAYDKLEIFPGLRVSGNVDVTGIVNAPAFSGSLTKLNDGSSFLVAGSGIEISTGSNGAVTIAASGSAASGGGGEYIPASFFVDGGVPVFSGTERSYVYKACTVSAVVLSAQTAPSGSSLIARINKNGSSLTTATLAAGSQYQKTSGLSFALVEGDYLTLDVTQVGSAYPGYGLIAKVIAG